MNYLDWPITAVVIVETGVVGCLWDTLRRRVATQSACAVVRRRGRRQIIAAITVVDAARKSIAAGRESQVRRAVSCFRIFSGARRRAAG